MKAVKKWAQTLKTREHLWIPKMWLQRTNRGFAELKKNRLGFIKKRGKNKRDEFISTIQFADAGHSFSVRFDHIFSTRLPPVAINAWWANNQWFLILLWDDSSEPDYQIPCIKKSNPIEECLIKLKIVTKNSGREFSMIKKTLNLQQQKNWSS